MDRETFEKIKFKSPTDKDMKDGVQRAVIMPCKIDDEPTFGELNIALGILARAYNTNAIFAIEILRKEKIFKQAIIGYQPIA